MATTRKLKKKYKILISIVIVIVLSFSSIVIYAEAIQNRSYQSLLIEGVFRVIMAEKRSRTVEECLMQLEESREINAEYSVPEKFIDKYNLDAYSIDNFEVLTFNKSAESGKYIFYLHGGAYVDQPLSFHYQFLDKLSKELECTIIMPIYPKAPNYTYETTIPMVSNTYVDLLTRVDSQSITVMGDSAGASMALSLCQYFKVNSIAQPKDIIMFSPALDATFSNPEIPDYIKNDPLLSLNVVRTKINSYAGTEEALTNYLVSPINGDITGLGKMTIFVGTYEILLADARIFHNMATDLGIDMNYYEYDKMLHVFPIYPIPESKEVRETIKTIIFG